MVRLPDYYSSLLILILNFFSILNLDDLDHITPSTQSLTSIFTLTEAVPAVLRLVGIANTHTLTSSSSSNAFLLSSNVQMIHFAQLQEILQSRLTTLSHDENLGTNVKKFLPNPTLMLLTKKVAALTGDVRSLFELLRDAIDLAVAQVKKPSEDDNPLNIPLTTVTPQHILAVLKAESLYPSIRCTHCFCRRPIHIPKQL
jgi:cell division control protein 6